MDKRFQVFVSSTYEDLQAERQEVMHALLELDCIPSGMELFPAANEDQWTVIKKVIDDCDYYLVIVAGKYGSLGPDGRSYTEMEYRYALEQGKPIIAFLYKDPGVLPANRTEPAPDARKKLEEFRSLCQQKMCKFWSSATELGSIVSRSVVRLTKAHPAVGWVRADLVPDEGASNEILRARRRIEELEAALSRAAAEPPPGTDVFAQGDEKFDVQYTFSARHEQTLRAYSSSFQATWNEMFAAVSPFLIDELSERAMHSALGSFARERAEPELRKDPNLKDRSLQDFRFSPQTFQTIKVQLRALGLIAKSTKQRSLRDTETYWTLTPYGDTLMTKLRAIHRTKGDGT